MPDMHAHTCVHYTKMHWRMGLLVDCFGGVWSMSRGREVEHVGHDGDDDDGY